MLSVREQEEVKELAKEVGEYFYERVADNLSDIMDGDSAKHVSEKMEEGWILLLETILGVAKSIYGGN
jgi:hypothetical protein